MTKILALDTSTMACSAALLLDEEVIEQFVIAPAGHGNHILPMIEDLLSQAEFPLASIDAIAFGCGPGSFTGLRMAASVTQALAFAVDLPVIAISTLAAMAQGIWRSQQIKSVLVALDARMAEVYWGIYTLQKTQNKKHNLMSAVIPDEVSVPTLVSLPPIANLENQQDQQLPWQGAGNGWSVYQESLKRRLSGFTVNLVSTDDYPHAQDIAILAEDAWQQGLVLSAAEALPVYLRDKVTQS